ncbi:LytR/AlgR family response regulator transcription factor [Sphingobacterium sp. SGR-19]|uniref:LytR/AlgR family response regulator transcription factor n=1 Tax=Sphingobacterium sp. SGR-19 TaxID=2710886 RepID=UPI0013EDA73B|nr:LytTR family DNA-binding domain-containing protein [Sphingobacterium sp. SGR-19]NGM64164.1 response regulator transcription factor [Sphingobacterium sp. SGR-19]
MKKSVYTLLMVDDQPGSIMILHSLLSEFPFLEVLPIESDPLKAFTFLRDNPVDLLFIDMQMPDLDGIKLLNLLQKPPVFAVCSGYTNQAYDASKRGMIGYIPKMPAIEDLESLLWRMIAEVDRREEEKRDVARINVVDVNRMEFSLLVSDIRYISSQDKIMSIVTTKETICVRSKLELLMELLPSGLFSRVHQSFIVALDAVVAHNGSEINLEDVEPIIPIGRKYREQFNTDLATYRYFAWK